MPRVTDFPDQTQNMLQAAAQHRSLNQAADNAYLSSMMQTAQLEQGMQGMLMQDKLGRDQLSEHSRQFDQSMLQRVQEFGATMGFNWAELGQRDQQHRDTMERYDADLLLRENALGQANTHFLAQHKLARDQFGLDSRMFNHQVTMDTEAATLARDNFDLTQTMNWAHLELAADASELARNQFTEQVNQNRFGNNIILQENYGKFIDQFDQIANELNGALSAINQLERKQLDGQRLTGKDIEDFTAAKQSLERFSRSGMASLEMRGRALGVPEETMEAMQNSLRIYNDASRWESLSTDQDPLLQRTTPFQGPTNPGYTPIQSFSNPWKFGANISYTWSQALNSFGLGGEIESPTGQRVSVNNYVPKFMENRLVPAASGESQLTSHDEKLFTNLVDEYFKNGWTHPYRFLNSEGVEAAKQNTGFFVQQMIDARVDAEIQKSAKNLGMTVEEFSYDPENPLGAQQRVEEAVRRGTPVQVRRANEMISYVDQLEEAIRQIPDPTLMTEVEVNRVLSNLNFRGAVAEELEKMEKDLRRNRAGFPDYAQTQTLHQRIKALQADIGALIKSE